MALRKINIKHQNRKLITSFYENWEYSGAVDLKFRAIKIWGLVRRVHKGRLKRKQSWANLQRTLHWRTIDNQKLGKAIRAYLRLERHPIRCFMSSARFLEPRAFSKRILGYPRMISSGIVPFEEDTSLESSIETAKILRDILKNDFDFLLVYTGNKSIHAWILNFNWEEWVPKRWLIKNQYKAHLREVGEYLARKTLFAWVRDQAKGRSLDKDTTIDTRRIVPIIGTLNAQTNRVVITLDQKIIEQLTPIEIMEMAERAVSKNRGRTVQ